MRAIWLFSGILALVFGVIGIVLPLLPTVPFLLLAAFCFARSSEKLHNWLVAHPKLGPPIDDWNSRGAIGRQGKIAATLSIAAAFSISILLGVKPFVIVVQAVTLGCVLLFIWTRPNA